MTIFAVLMPTPQKELAERIESAFPNNFLKLNDTQYLISTIGTVVDVSAKLGIWDAKNPSMTPTGLAVVLASSSYYGRAPANIWEWMKTKLESPSNG